MKLSSLNSWIRYVFPVLLALFLGVLIFMMSQFREPPNFRWYSMIWFVGTVVLIWEGGWRVSRALDLKFPWRESVFKRLLLQLLVANLMGVSVFLATYVLQNTYENWALGDDNPLGILHLMVSGALAFIIVQIINSVQIGYQLLQTWREVEREAELLQKQQVIARLETVRKEIDPEFLDRRFADLTNDLLKAPENTDAFLQELSKSYQLQQAGLVSHISGAQEALQTQLLERRPNTPKPEVPKQAYRERFLVRLGARFYVIPAEEVVAFYKDKLVLLYTKNGKKFSVDSSLEELSSQLNPEQFFRINRQCIVHVPYLDEMRMEGAQMHLSLKVDFPHSLAVSQRNVGPFKRWLEAPQKR